MLISLHKSTIRFSGTRAAEGVKRRPRGDRYNIDFESCCQAGVCACTVGLGFGGGGLRRGKLHRAHASGSIHTPQSDAPWFVNIYQTPTGGGGEHPAASEGFLGAKNNTRLPDLESELRAAWSALAKPSPFSSTSFHSGSPPLPLPIPPPFLFLTHSCPSVLFTLLFLPLSTFSSISVKWAVKVLGGGGEGRGLVLPVTRPNFSGCLPQVPKSSGLSENPR